MLIHLHACRGLEKEIAILIQDGHIQARIDSAGKILHKKKADQRAKTIKAALQAGESLF